MSDLFGNVKEADAAFTDDGIHRIWLSRIWDDQKPKVMFIGLNPSTANAVSDDPTIRKIKKIANHNGFGGVYMMNLFTFISTDPEKLDKENGNIFNADTWLSIISDRCTGVVFAWGSFKVFGRDKEVISLFDEACALKINQNGSPKHPLYCKDKQQIVNFK
jgi:hypothetical protein